MVLGRHGLAHFDVGRSVAQAVFELQVNLAREVDARGVDGGVDQAAVALDVPVAGIERGLARSAHIGEVDDGVALGIGRQVLAVGRTEEVADVLACHLGIYELQLVVLQDDARNEVVQVAAHGVDEACRVVDLAFERAELAFNLVQARVEVVDLVLQGVVGLFISRGELLDGGVDGVGYALVGGQILNGFGNLRVHRLAQLFFERFEVGELSFQLFAQLREFFLRCHAGQIVLADGVVLQVADGLVDGSQLGQDARLLVVDSVLHVAQVAREHVELVLQRVLDAFQVVGHVVHLSLHGQGVSTRGSALSTVDALLQRGVGAQVRLQRLVGIQLGLSGVAGRRERRDGLVHQSLGGCDALTGSFVGRGCQRVGKLVLHLFQRFDLCVYVSELLVDKLRQVARICVLIDLILQACNVIVVVRAGNERAGRCEQERTENQRIDKFSFHN